MKKKKKKGWGKKIFVASVAVGAAAAAYHYYKERPDTDYDEKDVEIPSVRGTKIKATIVVADTKRKMPLVIFAHGFGAERTEGRRFTQIARKLATRGIASIMMDFAGCGKSEEDYSAYCLNSNLFDMENCLEYMKNNYSIDENHIGLVGYSMGGRCAIAYTSLHPEIKSIALFAPALTNGFEDIPMFEEDIESLKKTAAKDGYVNFKDPFGGEKHLGLQFFEDMEKIDVIHILNKYEHHLLYIQGAADTTVPPEVSGKALQNINSKCKLNYVFMDNANHGFGAWDNQLEQSERLVEITSRFFEKNL